MLEIITDENLLCSRADEIDVRKQNKEMRETILELKEIVREKDILCLTAPQIGKPYRILVMNFKEVGPRTFVNPIITSAEGLQLSRETCHSIPDKTFIRPRNNKISITYQTPLGKAESKTLVGLAAILFQHGLDHLDGLLLSDIGLEIDDDFDNASEEDKLNIINMYMESLDLKQKNLDKEIKEDKDLQELNNAIDFLEKLQKGEVQLTQESVTVDSENNATKDTNKEE